MNLPYHKSNSEKPNKEVYDLVFLSTAHLL